MNDCWVPPSPKLLTERVATLLYACALLAMGCSLRLAAAQCDDPEWQSGEGLRGFNGSVRATTLWDRDGVGGQPPVLVAAGNFTVAGTTFARNIAQWNGTAWEPFVHGDTDGLAGEVVALATMPNGDLIASGYSFQAGPLFISGVARWNGAAWSALGTSPTKLFDGWVNGLAVHANGDLIVVGSFITAGGVPTTGIARWNGVEWLAVSPLIGNGATAVTTDGVGNVVAAGTLTAAGGGPASKLALFNGTSWSTFAPGYFRNIQAVAVLPGGDVVVGGDGVARWNGSSWVTMDEGLSGTVMGFKLLSNGTLVALGVYGVYEAGLGTISSLGYWDGTAWHGIGDGKGPGSFSATELPDGDLVVGGNFTTAGSVTASRIARWDGAQWNAYGTGFSGFGATDAIKQLVRMTNSTEVMVVAAGSFTAAGSVEARGVARWNGSSWSPMVGASGLLPAGVLARLNNGELIGSNGYYTGSEANFTTYPLVRWVGDDWVPYGAANTFQNPAIRALAVMTNGNVVAGGPFSNIGGFNVSTLAQWNGVTWSHIGPPTGGDVRALAVLPNGDLIVGGEFDQFGGVAASRIARWDGNTWSPLGVGVNGPVNTLKVAPNGDLLVGGQFGLAGGVLSPGIARWDGVGWSTLGSGVPNINAITVLSNGDIVVGGYFGSAGSAVTANIARWNGSAWFGLGGDGTYGARPDVFALESLPDGGFVMGGQFEAVDGRMSSCFAHWGCPLGTVAGPVLGNVNRGQGGFRFSFDGAPGKSYEIRYTQDFQMWDFIQGGLQGKVNFEDTDPGRRANPWGFYRAQEE